MKQVLTNDGSYTLYSEQFSQNYHSVQEGALEESLQKHIVPALSYHKDKNELNILDICFGIGYNALATLYYLDINNLDIKVNIYSPEFDTKLIKSLKDFQYPKEFLKFKNIIEILSRDFFYKDDNIAIEIYNGDAREYLKKFNKKIDIVYQDPFSSDVNKSLWTKEYFELIKKISDDDTIITTYSIATPIRLAMWENGFNIYEIQHLKKRSTIALNKKKIDSNYKFIDMKLKKERNKNAYTLKD